MRRAVARWSGRHDGSRTDGGVRRRRAGRHSGDWQRRGHRANTQRARCATYALLHHIQLDATEQLRPTVNKNKTHYIIKCVREDSAS